MRDVVKTIAYVRVSSKAQDDASQRSAIRRAAAARGDTIEAWYAEKVSGARVDRLKLAALRNEVTQGRVAKVYLFRMDRLTRSGVGDTFAIIEELRAHGVTLFCVSEDLTIKPGSDDTTSVVLVFALALAAKLERVAINERIAAARVRLEAEGRNWGRRSEFVGPTLAKAQKMRAAGASIRAISVALKVPRNTVHRGLTLASRKARPDRAA